MQTSIALSEFRRRFSQLTEEMRPGESITVTRRGKPIGEFTKKPVKIKMPDFKRDAERAGISVEAGDRVLARLLRDLGYE
jgi:hypothetical protein